MRNMLAVGGAVMALALTASGAQAVELVTNGDFETGDFTGWTLYTTGNGTLGYLPAPQVASFDTTGSGASNAAEFQVGDAVFTGLHEGGGISQSITTIAGLLTFSADFASLGGQGGGNSSGGLFSVLLDGVTLDSFDTAGIGESPAIERGSLSFSVAVGAGVHVLSLQATRPYTTGQFYNDTPMQYFDNVSATQSGAVVPEPATWALMITGFGLAGAGLRRRQGVLGRARGSASTA